MKHGLWSEDEHDRFLMAIKKFPRGPWSAIALSVRSRSVRQVQTHTQKYYEKIIRRMRGLRKDRKTWARVEHRIDNDILKFCERMKATSSVTLVTSAPASPETTRAIASRLTSSPTATISPCNSPLQYCNAFAAAGGEMRREAESRSGFVEKGDSVDEPLTIGRVSALLLPPFEEALDFLIASMQA
ncbi:hypothetical protein BBJ28_00006359 [Nothophytophthora sp. Chile5]|nr:hypothetical protein BBJ28_00006359 [Nothophytophthora sp. Chile5]